MITQEVVHKLRDDREELLGSMDSLCMGMQGSPAHPKAKHLAEELRKYVGLVDAVLDACSVEADP